MPAKATQISAIVSKSTKELLENYSRSVGVKKGYLVEMAIRHHLQALQELPSDVIVKPVLVVSRASGDAILTRLGAPAEPTPELRELMTDDGD